MRCPRDNPDRKISAIIIPFAEGIIELEWKRG